MLKCLKIILLLLSLVAPATASAGTLVKLEQLHHRLRDSDSLISEVVEAEREAQDQILCIALNIYHEVRGGSPDHQWAVAFVTTNRTKHQKFPSTPCSVVWEKNQFVWTKRAIEAILPRERSAWAESQRKALKVFTGEKMNDPTNGATHFYQARLNPEWARRLVDKIRIETHMFARLPGSN